MYMSSKSKMNVHQLIDTMNVEGATNVKRTCDVHF